MLTHRLMIAKRLYSILKRNVINRFVRIFVLLFLFFLSLSLLLLSSSRASPDTKGTSNASGSESDEDFTLYSTEFCFWQRWNTFIVLLTIFLFRIHLCVSLLFASQQFIFAFSLFRLILLILFLCVDAWESTWLNTTLDRYCGSGKHFPN